VPWLHFRRACGMCAWCDLRGRGPSWLHWPHSGNREPRPMVERNAPAEGPPRTALVVGGGGFIGGFIVAALRSAGWRVRPLLRRGTQDADAIVRDLGALRAPADWEPLLEGVAVVVNAAGILRETRADRFEAIHLQLPLALAQACVRCGVRRFVQVSAVGHVEDGAFIGSKHAADRALQQLDGLSVVVLRPSVVYSPAGSYGGTSLLRTLASMPGCVPVPGHGR